MYTVSLVLVHCELLLYIYHFLSSNTPAVLVPVIVFVVLLVVYGSGAVLSLVCVKLKKRAGGSPGGAATYTFFTWTHQVPGPNQLQGLETCMGSTKLILSKCNLS